MATEFKPAVCNGRDCHRRVRALVTHWSTVLHTLALLLVAALLLPGPVMSQTDEPTAGNAEQRVADFASFCRFVEQEYAYLDQKKTDWKRACAAYALRAAGAVDRTSTIELLEQALGELYDAHAHLGTNTPHSYRLVPSQTDLVATWQAGRAVIVDVRRRSAAERAGVRAGMEVLAIDGEPIDAIVRSIAPKFLSADDPAARAWALQVALAGRRDRDAVRLRTQVDNRRSDISYVPRHAEPASTLSSHVVGGVGVVRIHNSLGQPALVAAFDEALAAMQEVAALVIDLRDTPSGGTSSVARGIMGRLVDRPLPYQRHELVAEFRSSGVRRVWDEYVAPRAALFPQPVVVLVGRWTGSMGEGLAIGLNAVRTAPVIGQPMAHLLGANGETVLPHSRIVVRIPTEKLFHVDGMPREAVVPCAAPPATTDSTADDAELAAAIAVAQASGAGKPITSLLVNCHGLRPPTTAPLAR